MFNKAVKE
jgi:hypothetical protein